MFNPNDKTFNRWFVVFGAILIQASLGAIYIYSVFKPALKNNFPSWSATDLALPAQAVLAFFALSMIVSGKLQDKIGPKVTAAAGATLLGLGMVVASQAHNLAMFTFGFGVLGGIGIGAAYVCPIAACVKWFPDKRGLVTGLAVAGFGAGGLIFTPVANYLITATGIMPTFLYLGLIFFTAVIIGSRLMLLPPSGFCPAGWIPPAAINSGKQDKTEFAPKQMIKTGQFLILWLTYFIGCTAGLMMIMNITNIWQSMAGQGFPDTGNGISESVFIEIVNAGALAVMAAAILNSFGRIAWGFISDRAGRRKTLIAVFILCGTALLLLDNLAIYPLFLTGVCVIGFCFGGFLALYPAITADYFGTRNIGANYGLMFSAYGAGGLLGPWLAPKLITNVHKWSVSNATAANTFQTGSYADSFLITGLLCLFAAFLLFKLKNAEKD